MIISLFTIFILIYSSFIQSKAQSNLKLIMMKNSEKYKLSPRNSTVRLKPEDPPTSKEDYSVAEFIKLPDDKYKIKYKSGYLCKKYADPGIVICDKYYDSNTTWSIENNINYVKLKVGNYCLKKMGYDKRESSKGYYLNASFCGNNEKYQFKIQNLTFYDEKDDSTSESSDNEKTVVSNLMKGYLNQSYKNQLPICMNERHFSISNMGLRRYMDYNSSYTADY